MNVKGLYKTINPDGIENDANIIDAGGNEIPIPESLYRKRKYQPDFDDLPTQAEYFNK